MTWFDSPAPDYTVKVYSKQSLEILDSSNKNTILHYDGQEPTGFTYSHYRGMDGWTLEEVAVLVDGEYICGLADIFDKAREEGWFPM